MLVCTWRSAPRSSFLLVIVSILLSLAGYCRAQNFDRLRDREENQSPLAKLVKQGRTDEACSMLADEFRRLALQHMDLNSTRDLTYELRGLSKKIRDHALMGPMLKELQPGDSTAVKAIGGYAFALELSGQREEAIVQYETLLAANPKEDGVRLRLLLSESKGEACTFGKHFPKVQPQNRQQFLSRVFRFLQGPWINGTMVIRFSEAMVQWAETAPPEEDLSWLEPLLDLCAGKLSYKIDTFIYRGEPEFRSYRGGSVYENVEKLEAETKRQRYPDPEKKKSLETQQRETHDRIAKKMLEVPQLASAGFSALVASQRAVGKAETEALVEQAKKAMFTSGEYGPFGIVGGNESHKITPAEFLARHLGLDSKRPDRDKLVQELARRLKRAGLGKQALNLRGMYSLGQASEESYSQHASSYLAEVKKHVPYSPELHGFTLSNIVDFCVERDLDIDLTDLFVEEVMEITPEDNSFYVQRLNNAAGAFLGHLAKNNSIMVAEATLTQLRRAYLGDSKKQRALWALLDDQEAGRDGESGLWILRQYSQMFDQAMRSREFFFAGIVDAKKVQGLGRDENLLYRRFTEHLNRFESDEIPAMVDWLRSGGLLNDLAEYDLSKLDEQETPLISSFLLAFSNEIDRGTRNYLHTALSKDRKKTFGESLICNLMLGRYETGVRDGRSLRYINPFNALGEHQQELLQLPPERQLKILTFVNGLQQQFVAMGGFTQPYSLEGKEVRALLLDFRKEEMRERDAGPIQKLLAAEEIGDLGRSDDEFGRWAFQFVQTCDQSDAENFVKVVCKVTELVKQIADRREIFGGEGSPVIANVALDPVDLQTLEILLAIYQEDRLEDFSVIPMLDGRISTYLIQVLESGCVVDEKRKRKKRINEQSQAEMRITLERFQEKLGGHLGDRDLRQLAPHFTRMYARLPGVVRKHIGECFEDEPQASLDFPKIDHAMRIGWKLGEFFWLDDDPKGNLSFRKHPTPLTSLKKMLPHQTELMALLQDESTPIHARLPIATAMLEWDMYLPPDCIFPACKILLEAAQNKSCISSNQIDNALEIMLRHHDDSRFVAIAGGLAKFWAKDFSDRNATGYEQAYARRHFPLNNATRTMAITDGGPELIAPLSEKFWNSEHWQILIESGFVDLAATCFRNSCQDDYRALAYQFERLKLEPRFFTKSLKKNLPDFLKRFDIAGERFVAEAFFATRGEVEHPAQFCLHTHEDRKQRVLDLCRRFKATKFSSNREKEIAAALLVQAPEGVIELASEIPALAKRHSAETQDEFGARLFIANLALQAHSGDLKSVFQVQDKLAGESNPSRGFPKVFCAGDRNCEFRQLRRMVQNAMVMKKRSAQGYQKMLPRLLQKTSPENALCLFREMCVLAHVVAGKEQKLASAWGRFRPVRGASIDMDDLIVLAARYADQQKMKPKQRVNFVNKIWRLGLKLTGEVGNAKFRAGAQEVSNEQSWRFGLELIEYTGLLNGQQIQELGPKLANTSSIGGELWTQLGRMYFRRERYQKASEMFLKALEAGSKRNTDTGRSLRRLWYVESLLKVGRNEKAKEELQGFLPSVELDQRHHWAGLKARAGL